VFSFLKSVLIVEMGGSVGNFDRLEGKDMEGAYIAAFIALLSRIFDGIINVLNVAREDSRDILPVHRSTLCHYLADDKLYSKEQNVLVFHGKITAVETGMYVLQNCPEAADKTVLILWSDDMPALVSSAQVLAGYCLGVLASGRLGKGVFVLADGGGFLHVENACYDEGTGKIVRKTAA